MTDGISSGKKEVINNKHPVKKGIVTIAAHKQSDDIAPGT